MNTIMKWKGSVGKGWEPIVEDAIAKIDNYRGYILQIKEKYGGLRIYVQGGDFDAIDVVVRRAEEICAITCEDCGKPGGLHDCDTWVRTLCDVCFIKHMEKKSA